VSGAARQYARGAAAVAAASAVALSLAVLGPLAGQGRWAAMGWGGMVVIGVAGGAWLAARHGQRGSGFLVAFGAGMLTRLVVIGIGSWFAALTGGAALGAFLVGLGLGFAPLLIYEVVWFYREGRTPFSDTR
jgi:hypothetical protein